MNGFRSGRVIPQSLKPRCRHIDLFNQSIVAIFRSVSHQILFSFPRSLLLTKGLQKIRCRLDTELELKGTYMRTNTQRETESRSSLMAKLLRNCFPCISSCSGNSDSMAPPFILWLHGLGDSGPANENIKTVFKSTELRDAKWLFPSAPPNPVTCNKGRVMPSWFDVPELPFRVGSRIDETSILEAVKNVHAIIDQEIAGGTRPENVFICGLSQGGALTLASVLLYPKTLGGGAVLSGWVPFTSSIINQFPEQAKKTPILWSHGTDDELVLFEAGQAALPFLEQAGVTCEFKAYPGVGHWISNEELQYIESWIKSRMQSSSSSS